MLHIEIKLNLNINPIYFDKSSESFANLGLGAPGLAVVGRVMFRLLLLQILFR
jgi:hypothetical protein